ncbi:helix-turn-helix domain-containing protein [Aliiglaciecola sp. M165]|uniref:helix-turn-helix domain-containing protein n=1 Tax=Aliiglaciecola sp. M165 TaxID=2593649 RepID=UPI0011814399|nr:helix-turn-helix transcriptional regulator [Aliiglaciecola sp. M165]TRY31307.1 helix-turn-helix transcriptional regulator [Aliiglaciecola sp. M165]
MLDTKNFTYQCRKWRQFRKLSQLELALRADISQRHLSYLETGKSHPSREMIARLCEAMDIPLREQNRLFEAAGYKALFQESAIDSVDMKPVSLALESMLNHHDPFPAVVVDRMWNIVQQNRSAQTLFTMLSELVTSQDHEGKHISFDPKNLIALTMHPDGLRRFMSNWNKTAPLFKNRLKREAMSSPDPQVHDYLMQHIEAAGPIDEGDLFQHDSLMPVIPVELQMGDTHLSIFSVISTFGTPQDVTTDELRIEAFYPMNEATKLFFHKLLEN